MICLWNHGWVESEIRRVQYDLESELHDLLHSRLPVVRTGYVEFCVAAGIARRTAIIKFRLSAPVSFQFRATLLSSVRGRWGGNVAAQLRSEHNGTVLLRVFSVDDVDCDDRRERVSRVFAGGEDARAEDDSNFAVEVVFDRGSQAEVLADTSVEQDGLRRV